MIVLPAIIASLVLVVTDGKKIETSIITDATPTTVALYILAAKLKLIQTGAVEPIKAVMVTAACDCITIDNLSEKTLAAVVSQTTIFSPEVYLHLTASGFYEFRNGYNNTVGYIDDAGLAMNITLFGHEHACATVNDIEQVALPVKIANLDRLATDELV